MSDEWVRVFNVPQPAGFLVQRIADNSPASRIGLIGGAYKAEIAGSELLVGGDIILSVGGINVTADGRAMMQILDYLSGLKEGDTITVKVLRAGQIAELRTLVSAR